MSTVEVDVLPLIKEGLAHDSVAKQLMQLIEEGKTKQFWMEDGLLLTKKRRIYVPKWEGLRRRLIKEYHDSKWAGHPGQRRTRALVEASYYWPSMRDEIEVFVKTCLICQQDKPVRTGLAGLLEPLPIPSRPWESVSLDFIVGLPKVEGCGSLLVVVDRLSKYATFIPAPVVCPAVVTARLFFKHIVKYWGLPRNIISDRDPRFTGRLWRELFGLLGSDLRFSTSFHPQTDGQTERINSLVELYLRHFVDENQKNWVKLVDIAQFSYNLQRSESTNKSPFEIATGQQPLTPPSLEAARPGRCPGAFEMAKSWERNMDIAKSYLSKAIKRMKKWADKKRRASEYEWNELVLVKFLPQQFKAYRSLHKGLVRRYEGPFEVVGKVGKVAYRINLPPNLKIHPVFHVSMLKPFHGDKVEEGRGRSRRAPPTMMATFDRDVEALLADRIFRKKRVHPRRLFLVKWKDAPESEATWEFEDDLWQFRGQVEEYLKATRTSPD